MRKVFLINIFCAWDSLAIQHGNMNLGSGSSTEQLIKYIAEGYEIKSAVSISHPALAGVQYILVKESKNDSNF